MKTYVLIVSRTFPFKHLRKGQATRFIENIRKGNKIHTIRGNYKFWEKRFDKINKDEAMLSLRYWSGLPFRSKQVEFAQFTKEDGIGLEKLEWGITRCPNLKANDGLSDKDFNEWFKDIDISKPLAIIHFTNFRYISKHKEEDNGRDTTTNNR